MTGASANTKITGSEFACGALALLALVGTWGHNLSYASLGAGANQRFWEDTLANPASRSITVDLLVFALPVFCWMFTEARRLGMRGIWLYLVGSFLVAISVALPIFIIHRGRVQRRRGEQSGVVLGTGDKIALAVLTLITLIYVALSFAS